MQALKTLGADFNLDLKASIGIATGFARVGRLGSDDSKDYTAIGDVVNLAARLQGKASAGEVLISEESYAKAPRELRRGEIRSKSCLRVFASRLPPIVCSAIKPRA